MQQEKIILGIDPGTLVLGFGVILIQNKKPSLIEADILNLKKVENSHEKLKVIFEEVTRIIRIHKPDSLAIEAPFYGKNVQSMHKLGRAQGVAIAAGIMEQLPIFEYAPRKIKQSVTGNGNASKEQVAGMLKILLNLKEIPFNSLDASDSVAVALCHFLQNGKQETRSKSYKGWGEFLSNNPEKIS